MDSSSKAGSTQPPISHGRGEDLVEFGTKAAGFVEPPTDLEPIDLVCERCSTAFVHTPKRARLGDKIYTIPPVPPKMCATCGDVIRQAELDEQDRASVAARENAAKMVVPPIYRDTATIDTFDPARAAFLREWIAGPKSLYLYGIAGAGKTHTAAAVAREAVRSQRHGRVVWWDVPDLLERLRQSHDDPQRAASIADEIEGAELLVLDNIGQEKPSEWVRERLYVTVNRRYVRQERVLVTSELDLDELAGKIGRNIARRIAEMSDGAQVHMPKIYGGAS
jgi:DNA replication protein DnaC